MIKAVSIAGLQEGTPFKKPVVELEEAAQIVSVGNLTWIECVVDNIIGETPKASRGFFYIYCRSLVIHEVSASLEFLRIPSGHERVN